MIRPAAGDFAVLALECAPASTKRWRAKWRLENRSAEALSLAESWVPHERFKGERIAYDPPRRIPPGGSFEVEHEVAFDPVDDGLENSFVVLRFVEDFRLYARLKVRVEDGRPVPRVVKVSTGV